MTGLYLFRQPDTEMRGITLGLRHTSAVLLLAVFSAACRAQPPSSTATPEIVTDRPDVTESSVVIPKGSLQLENGITWTSGHGANTIDLSETLMRFGVSARSEIRVVAPNYLGGLSSPGTASGFGDIALGVKQQLGPLPGGFNLSVIAALSLPTGADRVSSHGFDPFIKLPWSKDLKAGWSVGGMQSIFWNTEDGKRNLTGEQTFYIEKELTKAWDAFAEYAGDFAQWGESKQIAHLGTACRITPRQQVDFHYGFGLSHASARQFFAVGYSFRIDKAWHQ